MKGFLDLVFILVNTYVITFIYRNVFSNDRELAMNLLIPLFIGLVAYFIRAGMIRFGK